MSETKSPLSRLVLFMAVLAVIGSVVAGIHYYAVDLPQQKMVQAPANAVHVGEFQACYDRCMLEHCSGSACSYYMDHATWHYRCIGSCGSG